MPDMGGIFLRLTDEVKWLATVGGQEQLNQVAPVVAEEPKAEEKPAKKTTKKKAPAKKTSK